MTYKKLKNKYAKEIRKETGIKFIPALKIAKHLVQGIYSKKYGEWPEYLTEDQGLCGESCNCPTAITKIAGRPFYVFRDEIVWE